MRSVLLLTFTFLLLAVAPASAGVPHVVRPGETLWSIAAGNGFSTRYFAAVNGLSEDAQVIAGSTLQIPSPGQAAAAAPASGAPQPLGGYIVQPGDTLSALAARAGVSVQQ